MGWGGQDLEKSFLIVHALTDIFLDDLELKLINVQFYISHLYIVHFYQCSTTSIFALLENFRRSHDYSLTYHRIEFHTQTLSTATVILAGWLRYFFLTNQLTQPKNLSSNILYDPFSCRSQDDVRPTVSFPMMLQMNYLFSGNIPIFKPDYDLC